MRLGARRALNRRVPLLGWLYYLVAAHTTPRLFAVGLIGVAPTAFMFLMGLDLEASRLGFAVLAWVFAAMAVGYVWQPRLSVCAIGPTRVECGRAFRMRYEVHNRGRLWARDIDLDTVTYPDLRHLRLHPARLEALAPGASDSVDGGGLARRRGGYLLPPLRCDAAFPFGLWRWGQTDWTARHLTVYPRYSRLTAFDIPLGQRHRQDLTQARQLARAALEFHGCREFREGDALRHVHPRSSARLGVPVVKEFQAEGHGRTAVVVDTWRAVWQPRRPFHGGATFEAALSVAAAVVDALARTDRVLELLVAGPGVYRFVSAGCLGYLEDALDILAAVEPCTTDPLEQLEPLLVEEIRAIQSVCLILTRWDARRAALWQTLDAWQVGLKVVLLTPGLERPAGLPPNVVCVAAQSVLRGEVAEL